MAGIGFVLRKLVRQENLAGALCGYVFSSLITAGPWLFTIFALGSIAFWGASLTSLEEMSVFRLIIVYNFSISLVTSGPFTLIVTRYISDKVFANDVREIPGVMLGSIGLLFAIQVLPIIYFYFFLADLPPQIALAAFVNFFIISGIWLVSVFLSVLKDFTTITVTFAIGMLISTAASFYFGQNYPASGFLWGFNIGLGVIFFALIAKTLAEYSYASHNFFGFADYFKKYWDLALCGFFYNLAIWSHIWIMWLAPERQVLSNGFISYPYYDTSMFLAFLTVIPAMAIFFVNIETSFYEKYQFFYGEIRNHATYDQIENNQKDILNTLFESSRNMVVFQGILSLVAIFLAPTLFDLLGINYLLLSIFRIGVLAAFFHILIMFLLIILFYFDFRKLSLGVAIILFITNSSFTYATMNMGFPFYGYGYFVATLVTFALTYRVTFHYLEKLIYQTFVKNNSSLA